MNLRHLKTIYDLIGNDAVRAVALKAAERLGMRKDVIRLDTNDVCNIECIMCAQKPARCTTERTMPLASFNALLSRLAPSARLLYLSCSYEPLMTPHFGDYLTAARRSGVPFVSFATNGLLLTDELSRLLVDEQVHEMIISVNGFTAGDYNRIMFRSNFDTVMRRLTYLRDLKRERRSAFPRLRLNTILMKTNLLRFGDIVRFIRDYDIDTVQFRSFKVDERHNNNPGEIARERPHELPEKELETLTAGIQAELKRLSSGGVRVIAPRDLVERKVVAEARDSANRGTCSIPFFSSWIDHRGMMRVCCGDHEDSYVGNVIDGDFGELCRRRDRFRALALSGGCRRNCTMFINSSTMM
jgi:MoaA/NifB/PqqE/SkfB family radical SAM enzyme